MRTPVRRRISLGLAVACILAVTGCGRTDESEPHPRQKPEFTSSVDEYKEPERAVCNLITAEERTALAGQTMDSVVPVTVAAGTRECQWVHSLRTSSTAVIRLVAFNTHDWAKVASPQIQQAIRNPRLSAAMVQRLQAASRKLAGDTSKLSTEEICDIYWVLARASGFRKNSQVVFSSMIGRMRAAFNAGCSDGVLTMIGYGEYGLKTSIALYQAIIDLRKLVHERAAKEFGDLADDADSDSDSGSPTPSPSASASPSPSATASASAS